jgi:hypothetical protein
VIAVTAKRTDSVFPEASSGSLTTITVRVLHYRQLAHLASGFAGAGFAGAVVAALAVTTWPS